MANGGSFVSFVGHRRADRAGGASASRSPEQCSVQDQNASHEGTRFGNIEYGRPVTREALSAIEAGEMALRELGFRQFRVRHHGGLVRIEIASEESDMAFTPEMARRLVPIFKKLGFEYVTLDCEGFRSGSMNALLQIGEIGHSNLAL